MKTMCPLGYHHNGFMATHALGHMMYIITIYIYNRTSYYNCTSCAQVHELRESHFADNREGTLCIYIYIY